MGFATYTSKPIAVMQLVMLLLLTISNFVSWILIIFFGVLIIVISILFGYLHYGKLESYQRDTWINFESNPIQIANMRYIYECYFLIAQHQGIPISKEIQDHYGYLNKISKKHNYQRIQEVLNEK